MCARECCRALPLLDHQQSNKMDDDQQFCLRWNNHQSTLISVFDTLLENGTLVDCTLAAEGKFLKAHKVVLCACSPYFAVSYRINHLIFYINCQLRQKKKKIVELFPFGIE